MTIITIRAHDSVTALELVQKKLGDDALILSTQTVEGKVEIKATDDPSDVPQRPSPRIDILVDDQDTADPLDDAAKVQATSEEMSHKNNDSATNSEGAATPRDEPLTEQPEAAQEPETEKPASPVTGTAGVFAAMVLRRKAIRTSRVVLHGPAGAGKSLIALQLAALRLAELPAEKISFFFCGSGSRADGAVLAQKSHLLGMECTFCTVDALPEPSQERAQIVIISGRMRDAIEACATAEKMEGALGILALPCGLRADRIAQISDANSTAGSGVVLCHQDFTADPKADLPLLEELGLIPLWSSSPDLIIGGLLSLTEPSSDANPLKVAPANDGFGPSLIQLSQLPPSKTGPRP